MSPFAIAEPRANRVDAGERLPVSERRGWAPRASV
jgi:hypothetical protein